jgi:hypothetical protein
LNDGNERSEFGLEDTVKIVWTSGSNKTITVGKFGEDTDIVGVFVLDSICHSNSFIIIVGKL